VFPLHTNQAPQTATFSLKNSEEKAPTTPTDPFSAPSALQFDTPKLTKLLFVCVCSLITVIFILDLLTPVGVADGMLYAIPIVLTSWASKKQAPFLAAGVCTILTILGLFFSPGVHVGFSDETMAWTGVLNRLLSILVIWITAVLTFHYRRGTESALQLAFIVGSSDDAIIGKTLSGTITSWNKGAEQMFGYTAEEILGQSITSLIPPDRIAEEEAILAKLQRRERISNFETVRRRKDGQEFPVSLTISPITNRWGTIIGVSKIARDISAQKQVESLRALQTLALAGHSTQLKQSNEDLEQFAYIASHDLQEPLRTIHGFTQLLSTRYQDRLDDRAREYLEFVMNGAEHMQSLIKDLLKYSRIQAQDIRPVSVNAEEALQKVLSYLHLAIEETQARVTYDPLPVVHMDKGHFQHLIQNLITNALKFHGTDPPRIHMSARKESDHIVFSIRDNGIGISPEYHDRIFLPFKRLHTREEYQGTGIGLAVCKKIVERRGGRIWVESQVGKGTTVSFAIPTPHGAAT
jgi:PAS domain S-box-containing protein